MINKLGIMNMVKKCIVMGCMLLISRLAFTQVDSLQLAIGSDTLAQDSVSISEVVSLPSVEELTLLDAQMLARAKWYYSMDEAMSERDKVYKLAIKNQKLAQFPMDILKFPNLQVLDLSGNRLKEIPEEINQIRGLQLLNLYNNRLRFLPLALKDMEALHTIYAGRNRLTEVPAWLGGLGKLRRLDLSYNYLTDYEIEKVQELLHRCEITH